MIAARLAQSSERFAAALEAQAQRLAATHAERRRTPDWWRRAALLWPLFSQR